MFFETQKNNKAKYYAIIDVLRCSYLKVVSKELIKLQPTRKQQRVNV